MRLNRIPSDIVGCIFNMSDYSSGAIKQVESDRTREILLFNAAEINSIFADRFDVYELIRRKREILRVEGRVWFDDSRPARVPNTSRGPCGAGVDRGDWKWATGPTPQVLFGLRNFMSL